MNYCKIRDNDIANGSGVRVTIFVAGCRNHCKGCFQPETWDFSYGYAYSGETEEYIIEKLKPSYITGLTILGGEPFEPENQPDLLKLAQNIKKVYPNKDIWCYTGFTYEQILNSNERCCTEIAKEMLKYIDILVDGRFEEDLYDDTLRFRGSSNQRIINLKEIIDND